MDLPLFLTYRGAIIGNGFVAEVSALTQMLGVTEGAVTWLYGVQPGAIAASGGDLDEAHAQMREALRLQLVQFAREASDFAAFKARVEGFFNDVEASDLAEWKDAVATVRSAGDAAKQIGLPVVKAESKPFINITEKKATELRPDMNPPSSFDDGPQSTAANVGLAAVA